MEIKYKAKFFAMAIEYGVAEKTEIIEWADNIITQSEIAPEWAIELSLGEKLRLHEMKNILSSISQGEGESDKINEIVSRMAEIWKKGKDLKLICKLLYPLTECDYIEKDLKSKIYIIDHMINEDLREGFLDKREVEKEIGNFFKRFH